MPLTNDELSFLDSLARFFFRKIDADERFKNKRVEEWIDNMPTPPTMSDGTVNQSSLQNIVSLHEHLSAEDARHSAYGAYWPSHVAVSFEREIQKLKELRVLVTWTAQ